MSTSGGPLAAGLRTQGVQTCRAGARGAESIALWVFSLLAWEGTAGTRYNRVVKWQSRKHQCFAGEG